jgi:hypothetical protein
MRIKPGSLLLIIIGLVLILIGTALIASADTPECQAGTVEAGLPFGFYPSNSRLCLQEGASKITTGYIPPLCSEILSLYNSWSYESSAYMMLPDDFALSNYAYVQFIFVADWWAFSRPLQDGDVSLNMRYYQANGQIVSETFINPANFNHTTVDNNGKELYVYFVTLPYISTGGNSGGKIRISMNQGPFFLESGNIFSFQISYSIAFMPSLCWSGSSPPTPTPAPSPTPLFTSTPTPTGVWSSPTPTTTPTPGNTAAPDNTPVPWPTATPIVFNFVTVPAEPTPTRWPTPGIPTLQFPVVDLPAPLPVNTPVNALATGTPVPTPTTMPGDGATPPAARFGELATAAAAVATRWYTATNMISGFDINATLPAPNPYEVDTESFESPFLANVPETEIFAIGDGLTVRGIAMSVPHYFAMLIGFHKSLFYFFPHFWPTLGLLIVGAEIIMIMYFAGYALRVLLTLINWLRRLWDLLPLT